MDNKLKQLDTANTKVLEKSAEILNEVSLAHERVRERALTHAYQLITAIGIVAGFGFTAIGSVHCKILFFVGEILLLSGMAVGMWFAKAGFIDEINYYSEWCKQVSGVLRDRMEIKFDGSMDMQTVETKMEKAKNKELSIFKNDTKNASYRWLSVVFYLFVLGGLLLLISLLR